MPSVNTPASRRSAKYRFVGGVEHDTGVLVEYDLVEFVTQGLGVDPDEIGRDSRISAKIDHPGGGPVFFLVKIPGALQGRSCRASEPFP